MQYDFILVGTVRDGQMVYEELFAAEDEGAALTRFEELRREERPARLNGGLEKLMGSESPSVGALIDRAVAAYNERDWNWYRDACAPDFKLVDRRLPSEIALGSPVSGSAATSRRGAGRSRSGW
jgi:hypothetical protein